MTISRNGEVTEGLSLPTFCFTLQTNQMVGLDLPTPIVLAPRLLEQILCMLSGFPSRLIKVARTDQLAHLFFLPTPQQTASHATNRPPSLPLSLPSFKTCKSYTGLSVPLFLVRAAVMPITGECWGERDGVKWTEIHSMESQGKEPGF